MRRREALGLIAAAPVSLAGCRGESARRGAGGGAPASGLVGTNLHADVVTSVERLGFQWPTVDPFLFCVHHDDAYPAGNERLGPAASLAGRDLGSDFTLKDGFRMYHGDVVPGFPQHPHRGFETVTVVRRGLVDHADSLGAAARYGRGDVQWMTAGQGIVHAEMFPLVESAAPNPLELFQIWLNLPARDKLVPPHFGMLWGSTVPRRTVLDAAGKRTEVTVMAGRFGDATAPAPPPKSWAASAANGVAIWTLDLEAGARFALPPAAPGTGRTLYFFRGADLAVGSRRVAVRHAIAVRADVECPLENGDTRAEVLMLQGRPIGEPVAQRGPFVMNTQAEIQKAWADYRATGFGGWPWPKNDPVHGRDERFARHADGHVERGA